MELRRFYSSRTYPKDGEHLLINGVEYVAHLKEGNEDCERCCFQTKRGICGQDCHELDCFDLMNDRRYYFTKEVNDGEEADTEEGAEGV